MRVGATLTVLVLATGVACADIVEWQDARGTRHFTNNTETIPSGATAQLVVAEPPASQVAAPPPAVPAPEPPRQAQVVYDRPEIADAYLEGLERGLALAHDGGSTGNPVQINGPLAVANAYGTGPAAYPTYGPLVTTSFDRGRSRHLTLRMLLEDQFQLDRDGPFLYTRTPSGLGVALQPFLPRGLPQGFPRGSRVLF